MIKGLHLPIYEHVCGCACVIPNMHDEWTPSGLYECSVKSLPSPFVFVWSWDLQRSDFMVTLDWHLGVCVLFPWPSCLAVGDTVWFLYCYHQAVTLGKSCAWVRTFHVLGFCLLIFIIDLRTLILAQLGFCEGCKDSSELLLCALLHFWSIFYPMLCFQMQMVISLSDECESLSNYTVCLICVCSVFTVWVGTVSSYLWIVSSQPRALFRAGAQNSWLSSMNAQSRCHLGSLGVQISLAQTPSFMAWMSTDSCG